MIEKKEEEKAWRPLKFETVEALKEKIDSYFESCYIWDKKIKPFTITW
jgi:hypothetical protein